MNKDKEEKKSFEDMKVLTERLEEANRKTEELLQRQEEINTHAIIAGETEAGIPNKEKTEEEQSVDSARNLLKGTGYGERLFPVGE